MELNVRISTPIRPTEELSKVEKCIRYTIDNGYRKNDDGDILSESVLRDVLGNENLTVRLPDNVENASEKIEEIVVIGGIELLEAIHGNIRKEEIIDTAYTALKRGLSDDECKTTFFLNKQVAYARRLNFPADEEPLGSVKVEIETNTPESMERLIDWLTPPTKNGVPVYELTLKDLK